MVDDLVTTINAAQSGDLDAFGRIVVQFQDMACAVAYGWLGDSQTAEDCSQEAFIEAYLRLPSLREPAAFAPWFRMIIYKHCDRLTRRKQPPLLPLETAHGVAATGGDPAAISETRELQGVVQAAIMRLPPPERAATRLYYLLGYSQAEIATQLGLPVATVKQRIAVARRQLRERLADQFAPELSQLRPSRAPHFARAVQFTIAVMCGDLPRIRNLLAEDRTLVQQREAWDPANARLYPFPVRRGFTPLHRAAVNGDAALASLLLAQGADPNARADLGQTPLHMAVLAGQTTSIACLLASGADPNLATHNGMTPLHWAVCHERLDLAQLVLAAGARTDLSDAGQRTAQDWARLKGMTLWEEAWGAQHVSDAAGEGTINTRNEDLSMSTELTIPTGEATRGRLMTVSGEPLDDLGEIAGPRVAVPAPATPLPSAQPALSFYETGIKVIDLFAPLARGGIITIHSPGGGIGKFVVMCELAYRHAKLRGGRVVLVDSGTEGTAAVLLGEVRELGVTPHLSMLYSAPSDPLEVREQAALAGMVLAEGFQAQGDEVFLFIERPLITPGNAVPLAARLTAAHGGITLLSDSQEPAWEPLPSALGPAAAHLAFSRDLAHQHIWPAIDPLTSQSTLLADGIASEAHHALAQAARALLWQLAEEQLGDDAERLARAQHLQRLQAQPYFVAEPFTAQPGVFVPLADTLCSYQEILDRSFRDTTQ